MNPWVLPAWPAVGARFGAEVTGMVLGWWRCPKSSCTPSTPSLKLHPWGCLAVNPPVMWGLETAFFWEGTKVGRDGAFWQSRHKARGIASLRCSPLLRGHPGRVPPAAGSSRIWDSWWDACTHLRGLACVDVAEQSSREGRSWERSVGTLGSSSLRHLPATLGARELPRCLLLTGSCLSKGRKMTLKHYFKLWWDVVAWCLFLPLRRVACTPWGRSHAAQRSVGWTCLPAA